MNRRRLIAIPAVALFGMTAVPAIAQDQSDELKALITPESSVEIGIGGAFGDTNTVGMYSGVNEMDVFPIANGNYVKRDNETGTWIRVEGDNLGLSSRGFELEYERQGNWKTWFNFSQIPKSNPLKIVTGLSGIGSNQQLVTGVPAREIELSTDRYRGNFGFNKRINENLAFDVSYTAEYKEGDRQFGVRAGGSNIFFVTDPVDYWHHEANAVLNFTTPRFQLSGGTLVSFFINKHSELDNDTSQSPISLPLDNQAYKVFLDGAYNFTPTTQGTFKFSYNLMTQDEDFFTAPTFAGNNQTDLGGKVHNYFGQIALSSRPTPELSLRGKVRYEGRHDDTPLNQFISSSSTRDGFNVPFTRDTITVDGEASYLLPMDFRVTGFVKYEDWDRSYPPLRQASWRADTQEYTGGVRLRRMFSDTLGGEIGYSYASRGGSDFLAPGNGTNQVDPIHWGDRDRHKASFSADWAPTNAFSLQARVDGTLDSYNALQLGPRDGHSINTALDASYQLSRYWNLSGWLSRNETFRDQAQFDQTQVWAAKMTNTGYAAGLGLHGEPTENLSVGVDTQYSYDRNEYDLEPLTGATISDLPDSVFRQFNLNLWAEYQLFDRGSVKVGYGFTHLKNNDFGYDGWVFSDGTIISIRPQEISHVIGVSFRYKL